MNIPSSIAIRSAYKHHSANAGYKQILKYTQPQAIFGIDENIDTENDIYHKYLWLYEWKAYQYYRKNKVKIYHNLYAEEYYRFGWRLFDCPIVATFHQPVELLEQEISTGAGMGKIAGLTHQLNKKRFEKLGAAIVTNVTQKDVLKKVILPARIHVIPLGVDIEAISGFYNEIKDEPSNNEIITVGNWKRDWHYYFKLVEYCLINFPAWRFILINRKFNDAQLERIRSLSNIIYIENADDKEMYRLYKKAWFQFLPFEGAAGNNSLNESLALGCPVVSNVIPDFLPDGNLFLYPTELNIDETIAAFKKLFELSLNERNKIANIARNSIKVLDWAETARKTIEIYQSLI